MGALCAVGEEQDLRGGSPDPPRADGSPLSRTTPMPRVKHYFEKGHFYHITSRTERGVYVFDSDLAKQVVLDAFSFYRNRGDWRVYAFVIMANHVHVVAQETGVGLSHVVGNVKKWISRQLGHTGPGNLWERRFDDNAIVRPVELLEVVRYIHGNPVRIGLVGRAEDYFWSSARNYAGLTPTAMEIDRFGDLV
jgi:putative transposase